MADASCSGGNPFKRLVEHQSRDVSHHQDRLVDRAGSQSHSAFRSTPQARQGPDGFSSFMDNPSTLPSMPHHHHAAGRLAAHAAALEPAHAPGFAPSQTPQFQASQPPAVDVSNWAADFGRFSQQRQQQPPQNGFPQAAHQMPMAQANPQLAFQAAFAQPNAAFSPLYGPTNSGFMDPSTASAQRPAAEAEFDQEMSRWMASHGGGTTGNMEDVDAVMDQMARELELNEAALREAETARNQTAEPEARIDETPATDLQTPDLANLSLETPETLTPEQAEALKNKSDVSEAAERLLESVQHEDGEKWKNSVFLSLMRDFRDGRKDIVDNEIRETPENETEPVQATQ